jgi:glycosyltransferase involved in cell wall biosynthesis
MPKMRILFVIPSVGSVYGGPSKTVIDLAQALERRGVTVDIVTTNANGAELLDVPLHQWLTKPGYRVQYFPYISLGDYKWSTTFANWLFRHVCNYDVVHSNAIFSLSNAPAHWACQWHKVPYLMTPHGMLEPWALSYKAWKKQLYYRLIERPALNQSTAIQTLASPEADHIRKLQLNSPMVVIPNGIHRQSFESLPSTDLFYQHFSHTQGQTLILFLGRIDPKKGLDLLAPAFAQVQAQFPNIHLIVAGPDNTGFLPTAQAYFADAGCASAVTFTGMLSGELKQAALSSANIYVAPSYSEGFSMSVLEGMASGLPCVITDGCNFPEAATAQAAHVVAIDSKSIAYALLTCLQDPISAKAMGDRARTFIFENYTWDKIAGNLVQVYQAIVNQEPILQEAFASSLLITGSRPTSI